MMFKAGYITVFATENVIWGLAFFHTAVSDDGKSRRARMMSYVQTNRYKWVPKKGYDQIILDLTERVESTYTVVVSNI